MCSISLYKISSQALRITLINTPKIQTLVSSSQVTFSPSGISSSYTSYCLLWSMPPNTFWAPAPHPHSGLLQQLRGESLTQFCFHLPQDTDVPYSVTGVQKALGECVLCEYTNEWHQWSLCPLT